MLNFSLRKLIKPILLLIAISNLTSCGMFSPVAQPEIHSYQISSGIDNSKISCVDKNKISILQIPQMKADAPYNSNKMIYISSKYELASYSYNKWATTPQQMLTIAIQEKLLQSCLYSSIVGDEFMTFAQYRLNTQLFSLKQVIDGSKSYVYLSIIAQLIDNNSSQVIKSKTFSNSIEAATGPSGYVTATNQLTQTFLNNLIEWLH